LELLHDCCSGLDVHKDSVSACIRTGGGSSTRRLHQDFPTTTSGLLELSSWLEFHQVTHVVMESTGIYWKPVWHVLEGHFELLLANAKEVRNVPGRKSDFNDAMWLADLLAHGLIRGSFVPPEPIQELRDLTRTRRQVIRERSQQTLRLQKVLEDANIKVDSFLTNVMGISGRRIVEALVEGETHPVKLAALADCRVQADRAQLAESLHGKVREHHRFLLRLHLDQYDHLNGMIRRLEGRIEEVLSPFGEAVERLETIPGISRATAQVILAEIGVDMGRFQTSGHLLSFVGLCPRMDESAGKRRDTRIREGNSWLKPVLVQAAWAASRRRGSYFQAQYHRLKARRGAKKAIVAVAASLLTSAYHMLKKGEEYRELGAAHFDQRNKERIKKKLIKRLEALGVQVEIKSAA
jgi:transposase